MLSKSAYNADYFELEIIVSFLFVSRNFKYVFVCLVCFGLSIVVLSVCMRFSVIFCINEHIKNIFLDNFRTFEIFEISKTCFLLCPSKKWSQMVPPPIRIPSVSKRLLPGCKKLAKNIFSTIFHILCKIKSKISPTRV